MVGGIGGRVVARLAVDGTVYTTNFPKTTLALKNYKIQTDGDIAKRKSLNNSSVSTVVDLGKQLLQYAKDNNIEGVRIALSRGAPFSHDWLGMTALHFAAMNNQYEMCEMLLIAGINKDAKTKVDRTPLHLACFYGNDRIVELLLSSNCQINAADMLKMTALHWAVEKQNKSIVHLLLKYNADVTLVSKFGKTPIGLAVLTEQADILEELQKKRTAQLNRKINEEREKETSEAVNSIMKLQDDFEPKATNLISNESNPTETLKSQSNNLLQANGLSKNIDDSKIFLNSTLNNGQKFILSDCGKIINEFKKIKPFIKQQVIAKDVPNDKPKVIQPSIVSKKLNILHYNKDFADRASKNDNNSIKKDEAFVNGAHTYIHKNKNIRVISLSDFKKYYGDVKSFHGFNNSQNINGNESVSQIQNISKPLEFDPNKNQNVQAVDLEDISLPPTGTSTIKKLDNICKKPKTPIEKIYPEKVQNVACGNTNYRMTILGPKLQKEHDVIRNSNDSSVNTDTNSNILKLNCNNANINSTIRSPDTSTKTTCITKINGTKPNSNVIPLLTTSQICRQIFELRKQNEDLKRKYDLVEKERNSLLLRVERLEEIVLQNPQTILS